MTDTTLVLVVILTAVGGVFVGFFASRWARRRSERLAIQELAAKRANQTEQLAWKRGCGGAGDVTD